MRHAVFDDGICCGRPSSPIIQSCVVDTGQMSCTPLLLIQIVPLFVVLPLSFHCLDFFEVRSPRRAPEWLRLRYYWPDRWRAAMPHGKLGRDSRHNRGSTIVDHTQRSNAGDVRDPIYGSGAFNHTISLELARPRYTVGTKCKCGQGDWSTA